MSDTQTLDRPIDQPFTAGFVRHIAGHLERNPIPAHIYTATDLNDWLISQLREKADAIAATIRSHERLRELATRATGGRWEVAGEKIVTNEAAIGHITLPEDREYLTAAHPHIILQLLDHLEDRSVPAPDLDALAAAANRASPSPWWHGGIFLYAGDDAVGYLFMQHDVDFAVFASPDKVLALIAEARTA